MNKQHVLSNSPKAKEVLSDYQTYVNQKTKERKQDRKDLMVKALNEKRLKWIDSVSKSAQFQDLYTRGAQDYKQDPRVHTRSVALEKPIKHTAYSTEKTKDELAHARLLTLQMSANTSYKKFDTADFIMSLRKAYKN